MRPKPIQLTATTTASSEQIGPAIRELMIKNQGSNDVYIDFDQPINTTNSYLLEAGETLNMSFTFINLYYKAAAGTSTLHCIKILQ